MPRGSDFVAPIIAPTATQNTISAADFTEPSWVKNARQTIGTDVEPVYPMRTVHGGNQEPDTSKAPIGYRYDNGKSQYQYLDLAGKPTDLVNRGNLGEAIKTLAPIATSIIGANFLAPALSDLFGPTASDLMGGGGDFGMGAGAGDVIPKQVQGFGFGAPDTSLLSNPYAGVFDTAGNVVSNAGDVLSAADIAAMGGADITSLSDIAATNLANSVAGGMPALQAAAAAELPGLTTGAGQQGLKAAVNTSTDLTAPLAKTITPAELMGGGAGLTTLANLGGKAGDALTTGLTNLTDMNAPGLNLKLGDKTISASDILDLTKNPVVTSNGVIDLNAAVKAAQDAADAAAKAKAVTDTTKVVDTAAKVTDGTNVLKTLTDATGLTGTQLAALLSGLTGAGNAANLTSAINTGLDATTAANTASQGVLKDIYNQQLGFQAPYQATGVKGLNQLNQLSDTGYLTHQFDASDLAKGLAPNYDFMLQQGQMANQRAANVGGGALSGNTLQGLQNYTQNYAGNAYQNAFNNYQGQRQNIYNNLAGMAGIGQTANTGAQAAGTAYGKGTTDLNTALANAQAAASIGKAQALAGGTSNLANSTFLASLLAPPK